MEIISRAYTAKQGGLGEEHCYAGLGLDEVICKSNAAAASASSRIKIKDNTAKANPNNFELQELQCAAQGLVASRD